MKVQEPLLLLGIPGPVQFFHPGGAGIRCSTYLLQEVRCSSNGLFERVAPHCLVVIFLWGPAYGRAPWPAAVCQSSRLGPTRPSHPSWGGRPFHRPTAGDQLTPRGSPLLSFGIHRPRLAPRNQGAGPQLPGSSPAVSASWLPRARARRQSAGLRHSPGARSPTPEAGAPRPRISLAGGGARGGLVHCGQMAASRIGLPAGVRSAPRSALHPTRSRHNKEPAGRPGTLRRAGY
ncbi:hypothetical protein NDU88_004023 [Pleurodeles waltl]|uniref:Uncharacterized protein n=1 Tax=Pleurodeles waltl TaxID=8319 RepID=A0AAV7WUM8_PLEWA|nr:hypothetical protein NDU88_004023 [Pleurodeles waltl]